MSPNKHKKQEKVRILVVDDEESHRTLMQIFLESVGCEVLLAESGPVALDLAKNERFSLIFTDIVMPGMDGIEFFEELRSLGNETKVVIVSAVASRQTIEGMRKMGAFDCLCKPIEKKELMAVINRAMEVNCVGD